MGVSQLNLFLQSYEWVTMSQIINYQKRDNLGKIMYKLDEPEEKTKFQKKETISFAILVLFCIADIGNKALLIYQS